MAIVYYPDKTLKRLAPSIDRVMAKRNVDVIRGVANVSANALSLVVSANNDWQLNNIKLNFNSATSKEYGWKVISGQKVVEAANDYLWLQMEGTLWTKITLDAGFYTGTQLAAHLQDKLDVAFTPITFTVAYDVVTGLFTITPSSGTIKYIHSNQAQTLPYRQSIAGHLFGLTATTNFAGSITSDTPVYGLDSESDLVHETSSVITEHFNDDLHILSVDQAINLFTNAAPVIVTYELTYEEIV